MHRLDAILTLGAAPPGSSRSGDLPAHAPLDGFKVRCGQCRQIASLLRPDFA